MTLESPGQSPAKSLQGLSCRGLGFRGLGFRVYRVQFRVQGYIGII